MARERGVSRDLLLAAGVTAAILFATAVLVLPPMNRAVASLIAMDVLVGDAEYSRPIDYFKAEDALSIVMNGGGACGEKVVVFNQLLYLQGIKTRIVELATCAAPPCGHTAIEVWDGSKWRLFDPYASEFFDRSAVELTVDYAPPAKTDSSSPSVITPGFLKTLHHIWLVESPELIWHVELDENKEPSRLLMMVLGENDPYKGKLPEYGKVEFVQRTD